jgi:transposase
MITVDTVGRVRRAYFVQGRKIKAIARELKLARNTVRDIVRAGAGGEEVAKRKYVRKEQPLPQLNGFVATLETLLAANVDRPKRERLSYQRMFEELRLAGYQGGYDNVRRHARQWAVREGERVATAYVLLSFASGEAYQFDWSHEVVLLDGVAFTVKVAQIRLCHSRMPFVRAYMRESQEMVFDAHEKAFAFFKGVPKRGIYDNMKTAVEAVFIGKDRKFNRRFEQLMSHHLIEAPVGVADKGLGPARRQPAGRRGKSRTRLALCGSGSLRRGRRSRPWMISMAGLPTSAWLTPRRSRIQSRRTGRCSRCSRPNGRF